MNPRQRRGALLVVVALAGAVAVFASVLSFVSSVSAKVGPLVGVVALSHDVAPFTAITPADVTVVEVPRQWAPAGAVLDAASVVGLVSPSALPAGTYAQAGMFETSPGVADGYREVAILVDAETGVAGKVSAGDRVDVIATTAADGSAGGSGTAAGAPTAPATAQVWVQDALVLNVGVVQDVQADTTGGLTEGKAVPVTFALPVADALRLAYAESFAVKVRLALRGGGDDAPVATDQQVFTEGSR